MGNSCQLLPAFDPARFVPTPTPEREGWAKIPLLPLLPHISRRMNTPARGLERAQCDKCRIPSTTSRPNPCAGRADLGRRGPRRGHVGAMYHSGGVRAPQPSLGPSPCGASFDPRASGLRWKSKNGGASVRFQDGGYPDESQ